MTTANKKPVRRASSCTVGADVGRDPHAGKRIKCGICGDRIRKGARYWYIGPWILCKECHDYCHGPS